MPFNSSQHIALKDAAKKTGYEESYLNGTGAARYGLTRFTSKTIPMFYLKTEIDKLVSAMNGSARGKRHKINGHRPRPARLGARFVPGADTNITAPTAKNGNGEITMVGSVDVIRQLLTEGFNVRVEVSE